MNIKINHSGQQRILSLVQRTTTAAVFFWDQMTCKVLLRQMDKSFIDVVNWSEKTSHILVLCCTEILSFCLAQQEVEPPEEIYVAGEFHNVENESDAAEDPWDDDPEPGARCSGFFFTTLLCVQIEKQDFFARFFVASSRPT